MKEWNEITGYARMKKDVVKLTVIRDSLEGILEELPPV